MQFQLSLMTALALAATGCLGTDTTEVVLGQEFELSPNQSSRVSGTPLVIGFRRVVADTRCPIDLQCVAEGEAGIELDLFGSDQSDPILVSAPLPNTWSNGRYQIRLLDLLPHPIADRVIGPDEYRLRLVVDLAPQ